MLGDPGVEVRRRGLTVLAAGGLAAVLATSWWSHDPPWWLAASDTVAGSALAVSALAVVRLAPRLALVLAAASWTWAATAAGAPLGGLTRAFLVQVVLDPVVRGARGGRRRALVALVLAYASAVPVVDDVGWSWLVVAAVLVVVPRRAGAWLPTLAVVILLAERAWVARSGLVSTQEAALASAGYAACVLLAAASSAVIVRRARPARGAVIDRVLDLAGSGEESRVAAALAEALDDPDLALDLTDDGLVFESVALDRDPMLADSVAEVGRLVVANRTLRHDLDATLADLQESSARLISAADDQLAAHRTRLERGPRRRLARVDALLAMLPPEAASGTVNVSVLRERLGRADAAIAGLGASSVAPQTIAELSTELREMATRLFDASTVEVGATSGRPVSVTTCWFVCAEALANAAKHSGARAVSVVVAQDAETLSVDVVDDGCGGADPDGWGLRGLRSRVTSLGGRFSVVSARGAGTRVHASVPR